ncbi:MAG: hypothetical protein WC495_02705 [Patescibacteria group bacterium]|jgi:uncharacterized repeat protein (TIGR01451 family)
MGKKPRKPLDDHSIPIRVTQAKNAARSAQEIAQAEDHLSVPHEHFRKGDASELEKLLGRGGKKDMSKFVQGNSRKRLLIKIIIILVVLFSLAFAGFLYFTRGANKFGQDVGFTISTSEQASSGEVISLTVDYVNNESIGLRDVELIMQFPEGFTFQSSTPQNTAPNTWLIGDIDAHGGGKIFIKGQLIGDVGAVKNFSGTLNYTPMNFNYGFKAETSVSVTVDTSALSLEVDSPLRVVSEKDFETKVTYTNTSEEAVDGLRVLLIPPEKFSLDTSTPEADDNMWNVESLDSNETGTISFTGSLAGAVGDQAQFQVKIGFVNSQGVFTPQTEKTFLVLLIKAGMTLEVKSTTGQGTYADWGQSITYDVTYTNDGDLQLENVELTLQLDAETSAGVDADLIDWDSVSSADSGIIKDKTIVWTKSEVEALGLIKPGDAGSFTLVIPLVSIAPVVEDADEQFHILTKLTAVDSAHPDDPSTSEVQETRIATTVDLAAEARYYSDSAVEVGSGPLPPEVGSKTTYKIFWRITNTSNDISDVVVNAKLPSGISWVGDAVISAGDPATYNPQTREVSWKINRIPAGAGVVFPKLEASFSVSVTPTAEQEGQGLVLLNKSTLVATDAYVDAERGDEESVLTSDLSTDTYARGQGIVQPKSAL